MAGEDPSTSRPALRALVALLPLGGCAEGVLAPAGTIGAQERLLLFEATAEMVAIVVPVIVLALGFAWWFRASNARAKRTPDWQYDGRIEFVVWVVPLLVVIFLGSIAWVGSHDLDPYRRIESKRPPLEIEAVSLDWKWLFLYPQLGIASVNELALPVGTPVHFRLTSGTVLNSFFVPRLGGMIYTMPGMTTQLSLRADKPGRFAGLSGMFSGDGFSDMHFEAIATDRPGFDAWVARARAAARPLDIPAFAALARPSQRVPVGYYGALSPRLFDSVLDASTRAQPHRDTSHGDSRTEPTGPALPVATPMAMR